MKAEWDKEGSPMNLEAAAEDAYEWLRRFSEQPMFASFRELRDAKDELRKFLDEAQK
jgi:hypothetical protein